MKLDIIDTVLSSFSRISSLATLGIVGLFLALILFIGIGGFAAGALKAVSPILAGIAGLLTAVIYIAGAASISVGALRAFDEQDLSLDMFTDNIVWPFLRMAGSNIITQAFILSVAYILIYPIALAGFMSVGTTSMMGTTGISTGMMVAGIIVGLPTLLIILYILSTLTVSLPRIAVKNKRMFQSLDESVQDTKGNRHRIIVTMLPFAILIGTAIAGPLLLGYTAGMAVYAISAFLGLLYFIALLTELSTRLE